MDGAGHPRSAVDCWPVCDGRCGSLSVRQGRQQDLADAGITEWTIKELRTKYKV
ncbi:hypothetical protein FJT64_005415 [Amphibalanus amphitrite]|uniref:Uncharacterized protein n=1 Tax=Amphibalanus amphitrite TaxID=1232801 RepID=A0A6A4VSL1_AMPAM|nr:hypothetical protein FJT64_005415 [Amphibalanus amphitrite]